MFDPHSDLGRPDRGILSALQASPAPAPDPLVAAAEALAAACAVVDLAAIDAAVLRIARLRAEIAPAAPSETAEVIKRNAVVADRHPALLDVMLAFRPESPARHGRPVTAVSRATDDFSRLHPPTTPPADRSCDAPSTQHLGDRS